MTVAPTVESVALDHEAEIRGKVAEFVAAYEARDLNRLMGLFADDAEVTVAPGTFRGKHAIRISTHGTQSSRRPTRSRTLYWLSTLKEVGTPDFTVTADTPLYAVFKDKNGERTYFAYNARSSAIRVTFSTGKSVDVAPRSLVRTR